MSTALGLRGIGAKPKRGSSADLPTSSEPHSWEAAGLSRAERVIRFVESLPITSGPLVGTALRLRPWQRKFIHVVYATDWKGRRPVAADQ